MRGCKQRIHSWHVSHSWCFDGNGWVRRTHVSTKHRQTNHESWQTSAKTKKSSRKEFLLEKEREETLVPRVWTKDGRTDGRRDALRENLEGLKRRFQTMHGPMQRWRRSQTRERAFLPSIRLSVGSTSRKHAEQANCPTKQNSENTEDGRVMLSHPPNERKRVQVVARHHIQLVLPLLKDDRCSCALLFMNLHFNKRARFALMPCSLPRKMLFRIRDSIILFIHVVDVMLSYARR